MGALTWFKRVAGANQIVEAGTDAPLPVNIFGIENNTQRQLAASAILSDSKTPSHALDIASFNFQTNGTNYERVRGNTEGVLLASAARTATATTANQTNHNARGLMLYLNVTAASGTGGLQLYLLTIDPASSQAYTISPGPTPITATGRYAFEFYPGATAAAANDVRMRSSQVVPRTWLVAISHVDATSYTYSLSYALIL